LLKGYNSSTDAHAFTHIHTHTRTYTHTYAHTRSHSRIHAHTHTRTHTHKYTHTHTQTLTRTHAHTSSNAHTCTCTHTNTYTHTYLKLLQVLLLVQEICIVVLLLLGVLLINQPLGKGKHALQARRRVLNTAPSKPSGSFRFSAPLISQLSTNARILPCCITHTQYQSAYFNLLYHTHTVLYPAVTHTHTHVRMSDQLLVKR